MFSSPSAPNSKNKVWRLSRLTLGLHSRSPKALQNDESGLVQGRHRFYKYHELETEDHFRLLKVKAMGKRKESHGTFGKWEFKIVHVKRSECPQYETVSYAWGNTRMDQILPLADGTVLQITMSMLEALPYVARNCSTGYLWIDQVCINQHD